VTFSGTTLPPRPALAFQVGVTGHRALPDADTMALAGEASRIFRAIRAQVEALLAADQGSRTPLYLADPPHVRCICGLAEGADTMLAEAALAEGWELVAVLPFEHAEYGRDFPPGPALERFRRLLDRASVVFELEGARGRGGEPYAHVGQQIVEQSDLMLAVWDGLPPRGPGGTGEVVQHGLDRGMPVAVLAPSGPVVPTWHNAGTGDVAALLQATLLPPPDPAGFPHRYFTDASSGAAWSRAAVRWFERSVLIGSFRPAPEPTPPPPVAQAADNNPITPYFEAADRLAGAYAARYRTSGLMRYALVLPATAGSFVAAFGPVWSQPFGYLVQFGSLGALVAFSTRGRWERSQARFVAYRLLAEYLRNARMLAPFGAFAQMPGFAAYQARASDWTAWYGRAVVRRIGLPSSRQDAAAVSEAAASIRASTMEQIEYLSDRADRFAAIASRLKSIGLGFVIAGIAFSVARASLLYLPFQGRPVVLTNELALILPALAPVFLGLLGFGEYSRLVTRYRGVAAELQRQVAVLDRAAPGRAASLRIARSIADVMLAEAADWQLIIKARALAAY